MFKVIVLLFLVQYSSGANILGLYYHAGKSHHILGEMLLKELARRGHNVTMASPFPLKEPFPNYTDVHLTGILEDQLSREEMFMKMNQQEGFGTAFLDVFELTRAQTELTLNHTAMKDLLNSGTKFDVIIMDWFLNYAILYYGKLFDAPVIPLASQGTTKLLSFITGIPTPPSFIPSALIDLPNEMSFLQRVFNAAIGNIMEIMGSANNKHHLTLVKKYYNVTPTLEELRDTIALVLCNGHYSYESPRPLVPNVVPVGGFHVQPPKKLPPQLQEFMDNAKEGVIYFSLGSNMKSTLLPKEKQIQILKAFSKLPYKVLWKWEAENLENVPKHVLLQKWVPQNDVLAHPNLKLFITHGGLLSTIEAIHYGVPVLGIPIFGDQKTNIPIAVRNGYALQLNLNELSENSLLEKINELMKNPEYKENAIKRSQLLRDQPTHPMDKAVFWVEHVIRQKGGKHLQNSGIHLTWYQYFLLDVYAFLISILAALLYTIYFSIKKIGILVYRLVKKSKQPVEKVQNKND